MSRQLADPRFRDAILAVVDAAGGRCALAGSVGAQVHVAKAIGLDKRGPSAHAIDVVAFGDVELPRSAGGIDVVVADTLGFSGSVEARRSLVEIEGAVFPVAAPEHILGMMLAAPVLETDAKWACFILMRTLGDALDLEEARGFLKRTGDDDRRALLAELAYLAA